MANLLPAKHEELTAFLFFVRMQCIRSVWLPSRVGTVQLQLDGFPAVWLPLSGKAMCQPMTEGMCNCGHIKTNFTLVLHTP
jgi:hypothetical protein